MFTGLIEKTGEMVEIRERGKGRRLTITHESWATPVAEGESIAVQGVCLTAAQVGDGRFACDVLRETLERTNLSAAVPGSLVNLERAMPADGRFGGHMVSGHIDGMGRLAASRASGDDRILTIACDETLMQGMVAKGSVACDGVSLTVAAIEGGAFDVHIIPYTAAHTSLGRLSSGDGVNIELDMIGKYVQRYLERVTAGTGGPTLDDLRRAGFAE